MKEFYSQKELAERWNCSEATIIRKRDKGLIPVFRIDDTSKPNYPCEEIHRVEKERTTLFKGKEVKHKPVVRKPVMSASKKDWRLT